MNRMPTPLYAHSTGRHNGSALHTSSISPIPLRLTDSCQVCLKSRETITVVFERAALVRRQTHNFLPTRALQSKEFSSRSKQFLNRYRYMDRRKPENECPVRK